MAFLELARTRCSIRGYKPDPVEPDKLAQVLEAARLAPTAGNRQRFQLIVIHTAGREEELRRIYDRDWFVQPPIVICACRYPMALPAGPWAVSPGSSFRPGIRSSPWPLRPTLSG